MKWKNNLNKWSCLYGAFKAKSRSPSSTHRHECGHHRRLQHKEIYFSGHRTTKSVKGLPATCKWHHYRQVTFSRTKGSLWMNCTHWLCPCCGRHPACPLQLRQCPRSPLAHQRSHLQPQTCCPSHSDGSCRSQRMETMVTDSQSVGVCLCAAAYVAWMRLTLLNIHVVTLLNIHVVALLNIHVIYSHFL